MSSRDSYHPPNGPINANSGTGEDENVARVLASVESLMKNMSHDIFGINYVFDMVKQSFGKLQDNQERLIEQIGVLKKDFHAKKPKTSDKQTSTIEDFETLKPKVATSESIIPRQVEQSSSVEPTLPKPEPVKPTSTFVRRARSKSVQPILAKSNSDGLISVDPCVAELDPIKPEPIALKPDDSKSIEPTLAKSESIMPESSVSTSDDSRSAGPTLSKLEPDKTTVKPESSVLKLNDSKSLSSDPKILANTDPIQPKSHELESRETELVKQESARLESAKPNTMESKSIQLESNKQKVDDPQSLKSVFNEPKRTLSEYMKPKPIELNTRKLELVKQKSANSDSEITEAIVSKSVEPESQKLKIDESGSFNPEPSEPRPVSSRSSKLKSIETKSKLVELIDDPNSGASTSEVSKMMRPISIETESESDEPKREKKRSPYSFAVKKSLPSPRPSYKSPSHLAKPETSTSTSTSPRQKPIQPISVETKSESEDPRAEEKRSPYSFAVKKSLPSPRPSYKSPKTSTSTSTSPRLRLYSDILSLKEKPLVEEEVKKVVLKVPTVIQRSVVEESPELVKKASEEPDGVDEHANAPVADEKVAEELSDEESSEEEPDYGPPSKKNNDSNNPPVPARFLPPEPAQQVRLSKSELKNLKKTTKENQEKKEKEAQQTEQELSAIKMDMRANIIQYGKRKDEERKEGKFQVLGKKAEDRFLSDRFNAYLRGDKTMKMFYMLLKENMFLSISQDICFMHKERRSGTTENFLNLEKAYYQLITRKNHPDLSKYNMLQMKTAKDNDAETEGTPKSAKKKRLFDVLEELFQPLKEIPTKPETPENINKHDLGILIDRYLDEQIRMRQVAEIFTNFRNLSTVQIFLLQEHHQVIKRGISWSNVEAKELFNHRAQVHLALNTPVSRNIAYLFGKLAEREHEVLRVDSMFLKAAQENKIQISDFETGYIKLFSARLLE